MTNITLLVSFFPNLLTLALHAQTQTQTHTHTHTNKHTHMHNVLVLMPSLSTFIVSGFLTW